MCTLPREKGHCNICGNVAYFFDWLEQGLRKGDQLPTSKMHSTWPRRGSGDDKRSAMILSGSPRVDSYYVRPNTDIRSRKMRFVRLKSKPV